ncbi:SCO1860 family LAETG-anchored protein [Streptomyces chromofuscus]|uniref:LPXTG cell wall anchor domain-containing protein n=1 Tax=Streptomyces chromofuscus TaxID=42881 RepID=A0A7M2TDD3_STRCW|nr:SCO1860 family LAETG-anchored protein [Streptomyces chromofuscus]QOV45953.1 LPXTG cell wall anchor domain-containing protein [Streptomyces chromofuscus]GGT11537.1 LPXTG cell wall anchor domain-containing protein [Streptomyces chromofuscus]
MNGTNSRMPARRPVALAAAAVLAAGPAALAGAGSAHATPDQGRASALVLRTGLDVSLLNKTVNVPLAVTLNEVSAPGNAEKTVLTAQLEGVDGGKPFSVLRADVAQAKATVTPEKAEGSTRLANARLHVPGLPLLSLIEVGAVTSTATCAAGEAPVAESSVAGATVLGKKVTLTAGGTTNVTVPGVGEVRLDLSKRETTTRTAAATALELTVSVDPLKLNVAEVRGTVTLAKATCEAPPAPTGPAAESPAPSAGTGTDPVTDVRPQGAPAQAGLAKTGGNAMTPYVVGGALALLVAGGGAVAVARRNRG